jgi:hypothetical protein
LELDWFDSIQPTLSEIKSLGATIIVGLNPPPKVPNRILLRNQNFEYLVHNKYLTASQNWQVLRKHVETSFFRYWFAEDIINMENIHLQLQELRNDNDLSLIFSSRGLRYKNLIFNSPSEDRIKYWGNTPRTVQADDILRSIQETGTNFIGEPSFVTFRTNLAPMNWDSSCGYAIELDYYYRCTEFIPAKYVPGDAGYFGISVTSGTFKLLRNQYKDLINWIQPHWIESFDNPLNTNKMKRMYLARKLLLRIFWVLEKISFYRSK